MKHYVIRYYFRGGYGDRGTMAKSERQAINNVRHRLVLEGRYVKAMTFEAREMAYGKEGAQ